jgi:hypothetical protein
VTSEDSRFEKLGRIPDRWMTVDGFILSFRTGVFFDSSQNHWAMGAFFRSLLNVFYGDDCL